MIFILNQLLEAEGINIPMLNSYLDDIVCPGIVLGFALFVQQRFTYRNNHYTLPRSYLVFFVIWYSILFEFLFPYFDNRHYADLWDIVAYTFGTLFYSYWGNKPAPSHIMLRSQSR